MRRDCVAGKQQLKYDFKVQNKVQTTQKIALYLLHFICFCCIITLAEISDKIGKSLRTVKITMKKLQENGIVERVGGKKTGNWKVLRKE
jgi:DNA-binding Lrp family transcriptional regulator